MPRTRNGWRSAGKKRKEVARDSLSVEAATLTSETTGETVGKNGSRRGAPDRHKRVLIASCAKPGNAGGGAFELKIKTKKDLNGVDRKKKRPGSVCRNTATSHGYAARRICPSSFGSKRRSLCRVAPASTS